MMYWLLDRGFNKASLSALHIATEKMRIRQCAETQFLGHCRVDVVRLRGIYSQAFTDLCKSSKATPARQISNEITICVYRKSCSAKLDGTPDPMNAGPSSLAVHSLG